MLTLLFIQKELYHEAKGRVKATEKRIVIEPTKLKDLCSILNKAQEHS